MKKLCFEAFEILKSFPEINWIEAYALLFKKALRQGEKDLARQVFYQITLEAIRNEGPWILKEFTDPENENYHALKDLNIFDYSIVLLKVIKNPNKQHRIPVAYVRRLQMMEIKKKRSHS